MAGRMYKEVILDLRVTWLETKGAGEGRDICHVIATAS